MNHFWTVCNKASEGRLPSDMKQDYYASASFRSRIEFKGSQGLSDSVAITLYLLEHLAVSPPDVEQTRLLLSKGAVCIQLFGWFNPVPWFEVDPESTVCADIRRAFEANVLGKMFNAAQRVRHWREPEVYYRDIRRRDQLLARFREQLQWPRYPQFHQRNEAERAEENRLVGLVDAFRARLLELRHKRLHQLSEATARFTNWEQLIFAVARDVLKPVEEAAFSSL